MIELTRLISLAVALVFGLGIGYILRKTIAKKQAKSAEIIIKKAKEEAERIISKANKKQAQQNEQLLKKENRLSKQQEQLEKNKYFLRKKAKKIKDIKNQLEEKNRQQQKKLIKIAGLSPQQAKKELFKKIKEKHKQKLNHLLQKLEKHSNEKLERKAKDIVASAIQRFAPSQAAELTTTTVNLPNEDLKGRIIGKEGRNIHCLEKLTGVEIIVDDTPGAITVSGFNPIRRQIAKIALEKLIADGRIHPARIEKIVDKAKKEIKEKTKEAGKAAVYESNVIGLDDKLIEILGRLCFRTSYGQNALLHSIEVSQLSGAIAEELDANVEVVKKAGLLHDIGKAIDREVEGTHVEIGKKILQKFNIEERIIEAMESHHEEYNVSSTEAAIVKTADAISGARPGARKDTLENYLKRLKELEKIANNFEPVSKAYAIEAGREVRVFVKPEQVDDLGSRELANNIAQAIEQELQYPGEIKINVIRETRAIEFAR